MKYTLFLFLSLSVLLSCKNEPIIPFVSEEDACDLSFVDFNNEVLPLIKNSCATTGCHDVETHEEDLILTSYSGIMSDNEFVVAGSYKKSDLYEVISVSQNDDDFMPPKNSGISPLTDGQVSLLKDWIMQGALETDCGCDTTFFSFNNNVLPIFETNCKSCHSGNQPLGNISLTNYAEIKASIENTTVDGTLHRIRTSNSEIVMPQNGKMDDCKIRIIEKWLENGAQND